MAQVLTIKSLILQLTLLIMLQELILRTNNAEPGAVGFSRLRGCLGRGGTEPCGSGLTPFLYPRIQALWTNRR